MQVQQTRKLREVVRKSEHHWVGDGFRVQTMLSPGRSAAAASPFLLLDYAAPWSFAPSTQPRGVGTHPHKGFETVTFAYQGAVEHCDSTGAGGLIEQGDVQWMTAASGILHSEHHSRAFTRSGGIFEMVQVWVNLPARFKTVAPRYQGLRAADIPRVALPGKAGSARVIAGELFGARGPARTWTPIAAYDLELGTGPCRLPLPAAHNAVLLVRAGWLELAGEEMRAGDLAVLPGAAGATGQDVLEAEIRAATKALLLVGEPIDEPVVAHGPFVMNTTEEIIRAYADFSAGHFATPKRAEP